jgi:hypothetical protein
MFLLLFAQDKTPPTFNQKSSWLQVPSRCLREHTNLLPLPEIEMRFLSYTMAFALQLRKTMENAKDMNMKQFCCLHSCGRASGNQNVSPSF